MKRKIIRQGHNTLTLTLPTDWVKKLNLKAGTELDIEEKENTLIVSGIHHSKNSSCEIDITGFTIPLIWRYFQSAYRSGCNEIKIVFDPSVREYADAYHYYITQFDYASLGEKPTTKPAIAMIQDVVNRFIGVDIIESGKGYCIVREMAEVSEKEFDSSLRRIFLVILQMFDMIIEALDENNFGDQSVCKEIHTIDLNVDKLVDFCSRILNKISTHFPEKHKSLLFSSLYLLEIIGDEFKYMGKHLAQNKKIARDVSVLAKMNKKHFEEYYKMYYSFNRKQAMAFGVGDIELYKTYFKMKNNMKNGDKDIARHLMLISKLTLSLAELRIQMEF